MRPARWTTSPLQSVAILLAMAWMARMIWALRDDGFVWRGGADVALLLLGPIVGTGLWRRGRDRQSAALLRAHQHLEVMSHSAEALSWASDAAGNITSAGPQLQELFGYTHDELHGLNLRDVVHPQEIERLTAQFVNGAGWQGERWRCIRKDGSEMWVSGSALPDRSGDGRLTGFIGSCRMLGRDELDEHRLSSTAERVYERLATGNIIPVFQAIISTDTGRLIGAEALTRFPDSDRTPEQWFNDATEVGLGTEMELAALGAALHAATRLPEDIYVSVNVSPATLLNEEFEQRLTAAPIEPRRLVLEITEHVSITDYNDIVPVLNRLRGLGLRVAVDDAGAGYASFRHILRLAPEFIKLDRSLIAGLDQDPALRALAKAVVEFGSEINAGIIAEGIETLAEFRCIQAIGICAAQGYLLGRPTSDWRTWVEWHQRGPLISISAVQRRTS